MNLSVKKTSDSDQPRAKGPVASGATDLRNAVVQVVQITATREAFALWCHEGGLITWGHPG